MWSRLPSWRYSSKTFQVLPTWAWDRHTCIEPWGHCLWSPRSDPLEISRTQFSEGWALDIPPQFSYFAFFLSKCISHTVQLTLESVQCTISDI